MASRAKSADKTDRYLELILRFPWRPMPWVAFARRVFDAPHSQFEYNDLVIRHSEGAVSAGEIAMSEAIGEKPSTAPNGVGERPRTAYISAPKYVDTSFRET